MGASDTAPSYSQCQWFWVSDLMQVDKAVGISSIGSIGTFFLVSIALKFIAKFICLKDRI